MTDRDKLIELHEEAGVEWDYYVDECINEGKVPSKTYDEFHADHLLANGVTLPPCKVGDKVWDLHQRYNGTFVIQEGKISMLTQKADKSWHLRITVNSIVWGFTPNEIGTRYFLTKEEAEQALKEREKV